MQESHESIDITLYISIISSCLLAISEILPYIKSIKSNGIIEFLQIIIKSLLDKRYIQIPEYTPNQAIYDNISNNIISYNNSIIDLTNELRSCKKIIKNYLDSEDK